MHILNVEVKDCAFSNEAGRFQATLLMNGRNNRVSIRAATQLSVTARKPDVMRGLMADALRQMKRLPEYRNTTREITLAQGALQL